MNNRGYSEDAEEGILFFQELDFGWVLPHYVIESVQNCGKSIVEEKTLTDLL